MRSRQSLEHNQLPQSHLGRWEANQGRRLLPVLLLAGLLLLVGWQRTFAAAGDDPTHPLLPTDSWVALENGAEQWYAFRDEGDGTAITVRMTVLPVQGAGFTVLTAEQSRRWVRGESVAAVGAGSALPLFPNDLYWTGSFVQSGVYYVLVKSSRQGASNYRLTINGSGVSYPLPSFAQPTSPLVVLPNPSPTDHSRPVAPTTLPTPTQSVTVPVAPLSSPETPLPPIGKPMSIAVGETHWYAFRDEGDDASIRVNADATPDTCLTFQLWTPEQLRLWQLGQEFRPVGQGTANAILKADLFWTGSFVKGGVYYLVVKRAPAVQGPCTYKLRVMGDDVSLLPPPGEP